MIMFQDWHPFTHFIYNSDVIFDYIFGTLKLKGCQLSQLYILVGTCLLVDPQVYVFIMILLFHQLFLIRILLVVEIFDIIQ